MQKSAYGFTLIELVIAISIMAIIGVITFANYKSFGEDQNLKNTVLDIQSLFRTAQTSATTNAKCNTQFGATWQVEFSNRSTINLKCQNPPASPSLRKTLALGANIEIQPPSGVPSLSCPTALPFTISFVPINGKISLGSDTRCSQLTITLKNTKTVSTKSFIIEKGGRIYAP